MRAARHLLILPLLITWCFDPLDDEPGRIRGVAVGLYWELYWPGSPGTTLTVSLSLAAGRRSWMRKAAEWIGRVGGEPPLTLTWDEAVPPATPVVPRSFALRLPGARAGPLHLAARDHPARTGAAPRPREIEITE